MSKKNKLGSLRPATPAGGAAVAVHFAQTGPDEGVCQLRLDYRQAPVPERFYSADYCDVQRGRSGFALVFGKLVPGTSKLRTKIEIDFSKEMFVAQLWGSSRDFHRTVQSLAEKAPIPPIENVEDTDKVQTFRSNNVFMGTWGEESVMDFYYLSPRDMHYVRTQQQGTADLEPVIRVLMSTALLFEFLEKCRQYIEGPREVQASLVEAK